MEELLPPGRRRHRVIGIAQSQEHGARHPGTGSRCPEHGCTAANPRCSTIPAFRAASQIVPPSGMSTVTDSISKVTLGTYGHLQAEAAPPQEAVLQPLDERDEILARELALSELLEVESGVDEEPGEEMRRLLLEVVG
jgi:hypothetical protein